MVSINKIDGIRDIIVSLGYTAPMSTLVVVQKYS